MESVLRGAAIYLILFIVLRLSGRRTLAEMTTFDFVLVLIIAETTQQAMLSDDFSIVNAVILIVTLIGLDVFLSLVKQRWPFVERLMDGGPTLLITDGTPDRRALQMSRVDLDDVLAAARRLHGLERMDQIKFAILEAGGEISIVPTRS